MNSLVSSGSCCGGDSGDGGDGGGGGGVAFHAEYN